MRLGRFEDFSALLGDLSSGDQWRPIFAWAGLLPLSSKPSDDL